MQVNSVARARFREIAERWLRKQNIIWDGNPAHNEKQLIRSLAGRLEMVWKNGRR